MMSATADPVLPVDFRGNSLSLEDIKAMIKQDVAELSALYRLKELDEAKMAAGQVYMPDMRVKNEIALREKAHDLHWSWYRARINEST